MPAYNPWKRPETHPDDHVITPALPLTKEESNNLVRYYKMENMDILDAYIESVRKMVKEYKNIFGTFSTGNSCSINEKIKREHRDGNLYAACPENRNLDINKANEEMEEFFSKVGIKNRFEMRCVFY